MRFLRIVLVITLVAATGCATSNRTKTLVGMAVAGAASAAVGAATTPAGTSPAMHTSYFGFVGATVAAVLGLFVFDEQERSEELERQNEMLKKTLEIYRPESKGSGKNTSSVKGVPSFPKEVPNQLKGLVEPGKWTYTRFPPNTWRWNGTNSIVRECEKFELIPPRLRVGAPQEAEAEVDETSSPQSG